MIGGPVLPSLDLLLSASLDSLVWLGEQLAENIVGALIAAAIAAIVAWWRREDSQS